MKSLLKIVLLILFQFNLIIILNLTTLTTLISLISLKITSSLNLQQINEENQIIIKQEEKEKEEENIEKVENILSNIDQNYYLVLKNHQNKQNAADILANIRHFYDILKIRLFSQYPSDSRVRIFNSRYGIHTILQETYHPEKISYSTNKGELIALCLRSPTSFEFEYLNTIKFVAIHEITHVVTDEIGHTEEFYKNFRFLLSHAIKWGLYKEIDYRRYPTNYCGTRINNSPSNLSKERKMKSYL